MTTVYFAIEQSGMDLVPAGIFESLEQAKTAMQEYGYTTWTETDALLQPAVESTHNDDENIMAAILTHEVGNIFEMSKPENNPMVQFEEFLRSMLGEEPPKA